MGLLDLRAEFSEKVCQLLVDDASRRGRDEIFVTRRQLSDLMGVHWYGFINPDESRWAGGRMPEMRFQDKVIRLL